MTRENSNGESEGRVKHAMNGWVSSLVYIPITAILTWVFATGGYVNTINQNTKDIEAIKATYSQVDSRVRTLELGMERIKVQYDAIAASLIEIKDALKYKHIGP